MKKSIREAAQDVLNLSGEFLASAPGSKASKVKSKEVSTASKEVVQLAKQDKKRRK